MIGALLAGRRVLVTGGANGIGATVVDRFRALGATGVVLDLPAALAAGPGPWPGIPVDVTDEDSVAAAVAEAVRICGGLDGIVAGAGIVPTWRRTTELDLADFDRVLAVNVRGIAATLKYTAAVLAPGSTITVIGSLNSWRGDANIAAYAAAKHAVLGLVRSAALDLGRDGIRVNAVAPGPIATSALRKRMAARTAATGLSVEAALERAAQGTALGRIATADNVADTIAFLTSELSAAITGQLIAVDGGIL